MRKHIDSGQFEKLQTTKTLFGFPQTEQLIEKIKDNLAGDKTQEKHNKKRKNTSKTQESSSKVVVMNTSCKYGDGSCCKTQPVHTTHYHKLFISRYTWWLNRKEVATYIK